MVRSHLDFFGNMLRPQAIKHPRKRNRLAHVLDAAHPRGATLDAHAESGVRYAAVATQVEIPFKSFLGQLVRRNLLLQEFKRGSALAAADDLAITLRREHIYTQRQFIAVIIALHVKSLDCG